MPILPPTAENLAAVAATLQAGDLAALPTETVYGLAADATNPEAVLKIYESKGRPRFNPLIIHVPDLATAQLYGQFNPQAMQLAESFWPGPLTLVVPYNPQPSTTNHHTPHESPWIMLAPMLPLAVGAVVSGYLLKGMLELEWWQGAIAINNWAESGLHHIHHTPMLAKFAPLILAILGITLAWYLFAKHRNVAKNIAQEFSIPYAISFNKWYIDELYDLLWQRPIRALANVLYRQGDGRLIDGFLHRLSGEIIGTGLTLRSLQSGNLYHYALAMLLAVVAALAYVLWGVN